jgi:tetratricopeptide (TPR) repeat protein
MKIRILVSFCILTIASVVIFAQTFPVRGRVMLKKADGTTVPVADALVEPYRTDISKGKLPSAKTDKKGYFSFAGLPLGQTFALVVSAPGIKPEVYPNVKAGMEDITITVFEGDGKRLTEEEVRQSLQKALPPTPTQPSLTEEQKKQLAEEEKKRQEIEAKNKKIEETNALIRKALQEGIDALNAKNYDLAIAKFDEGINADPEYAGSAPVLLNNKAVALNNRAIAKYNSISKERNQAVRAEALAAVKNDLLNAATSAERAFQILSNATASSPELQKNYDRQKYLALSNRLEAYSLLFITKSDDTKVNEAIKALADYELVETDKTQLKKARIRLADAFRLAGNSEAAVPIYKKVLEEYPDDFDTMAGLGLCLFNLGVINQNKAQMQEGLDIMQKFADTAPDTHPLKQEVKAAVDYLKNEEKLTPQKVRSTTRKKS